MNTQNRHRALFQVSGRERFGFYTLPCGLDMVIVLGCCSFYFFCGGEVSDCDIIL
jgi:hypothetical protein